MGFCSDGQPPNNSFKPNLLRCTKHMAERACHVFGSTTQVGLTQALGPMRQVFRWSLLLPAVALGIVASWLVFPLGRGLAISACPGSLRSVEATTDFSQPDYSAYSDTCLAGWFTAVEISLPILAFLLSVIVAGFIGYRLPPSHKRLSAALSSLAAIGAVAAAFAYGP